MVQRLFPSKFFLIKTYLFLLIELVYFAFTDWIMRS